MFDGANGPRISSASRRKGGALHGIRGTPACLKKEGPHHAGLVRMVCVGASECDQALLL
jgi:hypothetical protein